MLKKYFLSEEGNERYFVVDRMVLKIFGISLTGNESLPYKIYAFIFLTFFHYLYVILTLHDLYLGIINTDPETVSYFVGCAMGACMTAALLQKREKLAHLLNKLELEPFLPNKDRGGAEEEKLINEWLEFKYKLDVLFYVGTIGSYVPQTIFSLYNRLRSNDYHDWTFPFGALTFVNTTYTPNFELVWTYQNIAGHCMVCVVRSIILIISGGLAFTRTQFQILQCNIRKITEETNELKSRRDENTFTWEHLQDSLRKVVNYHLSIIEIAEELEDVFCYVTLAVYSGIVTVLCFEVYHSTVISFSDMRMLRRVIELITVSAMPFVLCYCNELAGEESQKVGNAIYELNFVGTDIRFQKSLVLMISRSQHPVRMKAGKIVESSLATFVLILRTSYSAFTVLRNINKEER